MEIKTKFWEEAYYKNISKMIGICYRYVYDKEIAEDLAHDAFVQAIEKIDTFKGNGNFDGWLHKITVNTALLYLRKNKSIKEKQLNFNDTFLNIKEEEKVLFWQKISTKSLFRIINQLLEHHKLVFTLYVLDNYSHKEISEELNISIGTSKSHLSRARKKIKQLLQEEYDENKKLRLFPYFIFPYNLRKIDNIYQKRFADFQIKPSKNIYSNFESKKITNIGKQTKALLG